MKVIYANGSAAECAADEELHIIRHSAAHILAQAVKRLYPDAKFAYGPANEKGFYYDIDLGDTKLSDDDLPAIEAEMKKIVKENIAIKPSVLPRDEAVKFMSERGEIYKVEHIADLPEDTEISFFTQGDYVDMCTGPHLCYTKALQAFKLMGISGAYWKNDKNNKMLTRIKGTAFKTQQELDDYLKLLEEAENDKAKKLAALPEGALVNEIKCRNPRCITTSEQELDQVFRPTDEEGTYRCLYCESKEKHNK
jgi:threonyl-tRNA synthetase